jgi:hypothetical protein
MGFCSMFTRKQKRKIFRQATEEAGEKDWERNERVNMFINVYSHRSHLSF